MFPSASLVVLLLLSPTPTPMPHEGGQPAKAPIIDISGEPLDASGKVLDISERISNLDESLTDQSRGTERKLIFAADVLFAFDKATLTAKARSRIRQAAGELREAGVQEVRVDGYTDAKGSDSYNLTLSQRRAQTVRQALAALVPGVTFEVKGHGEADPVAPDTTPDGEDNPDGRAKNRRVEVTFDQ